MSPELELNDIGFLRSADEMIQYANLRYRTSNPRGFLGTLMCVLINFQLLILKVTIIGFNTRLTVLLAFLNNWEIDFGLAHKPRIFSNSILRGGPRWRFSKENFQFFFVGSDRRKKFNGTIGLIHSQAKENNFSLLKFESELNYQPTNALQYFIISRI